MDDTRKGIKLLIIINLALVILETSTTLAMPLSDESVKLDGMSSGQNALPDNLKDDDFLGDEESRERGSGDNIKLEEPKNAVPSDVITDKEVEKLIQAQDLGQGDRLSPFSEGSGSSVSSLKDTSREEGSGVTLDNDKSTTQTDVKAQESLATSDATQPKPQQQQQQPSQSVAPVVVTPLQQLAAPAVAAPVVAAPVTTIPVDASSIAEQQFSDIANQQFNDQSATSAAVNAQPSANTAAAQQFDATSISAAQPPVQQYSDDTASSSQQAPQIATQDAYANQAAPTSNTEQIDENKFRALICQDGKDTISCPADKSINVVDANYGSMGASDCLGTQQVNYASNEPTCKTPGAYEVVKTNCDDMQNCELTANDDIFGDECQSDKKYLDVTYNCDPSQSPVPASPYQAMYPQQAAPQYMYPPAQPEYAPSPYQAPQSYYPAPGAPYGQQQAYGEQEAALPASPPAPALPELMSRLISLSKDKQQSSKQQCSTCTTCNVCTAVPSCHPCSFCQSQSCVAPPPQPYIPAGLRPLWELWNEKTADMSRMEMSALIFSPVPKLPPTKKSSSLTGNKRSHVKKVSNKKADASKKHKEAVHHVSRHTKIHAAKTKHV